MCFLAEDPTPNVGAYCGMCSKVVLLPLSPRRLPGRTMAVLVLAAMRGSAKPLAKAQRPQLPAQRLFGNSHSELFPHPLNKVDYPPSLSNEQAGRRASLHNLRECPTLLIVQGWGRSGNLARYEPVRSVKAEGFHPIADRLRRHSDGFRGGSNATAVKDHRQSLQTTSLLGIAAGKRERT